MSLSLHNNSDDDDNNNERVNNPFQSSISDKRQEKQVLFNFYQILLFGISTTDLFGTKAHPSSVQLAAGPSLFEKQWSFYGK